VGQKVYKPTRVLAGGYASQDLGLLKIVSLFQSGKHMKTLN